MKNRRKTAISCTVSFVRDATNIVSQIGEQDEILRKKVHISYIDQFVVPPIFNYLIGAKNVEIRLVRTFDWTGTLWFCLLKIRNCHPTLQRIENLYPLQLRSTNDRFASVSLGLANNSFLDSRGLGFR